MTDQRNNSTQAKLCGPMSLTAITGTLVRSYLQKPEQHMASCITEETPLRYSNY